MGEIRFRVATRKDQQFFRAMELETTWQSLDEASQGRLGREGLSEALEATHELLLDRPGNRIVIAESESGERLGLLWFGPNRNVVTGEDEAWVYNVSVVPEHRGRGLGRRLLEHAETLARAGGFKMLGLMVSCHNEGARRLYERFGFEPTNVLMRKPLDEGRN